MNHSDHEWMGDPAPVDDLPCGVLLARHSLLFTDRLNPGSTSVGRDGDGEVLASRWLLELLDEENDRVCVLIAEGGEE